MSFIIVQEVATYTTYHGRQRKLPHPGMFFHGVQCCCTVARCSTVMIVVLTALRYVGVVLALVMCVQVSGKPPSWEAYEAADLSHPIFHTLPGSRGTAFFGWQVLEKLAPYAASLVRHCCRYCDSPGRKSKASTIS